MAQLSPTDLDVLLRLARTHGRLVHPDPADDAACVAYDHGVAIVRRLAKCGLVARPLIALHHGGRGEYRACLAPVLPRGHEALRIAGLEWLDDGARNADVVSSA